MDLGLQGKRALVTGASKGIGLSVARRLVAEGAIVVDGSRQSSAELDVLCEESGVFHFEVDLSEDQGPAQLVQSAQAEDRSTFSSTMPGRSVLALGVFSP